MHPEDALQRAWGRLSSPAGQKDSSTPGTSEESPAGVAEEVPERIPEEVPVGIPGGLPPANRSAQKRPLLPVSFRHRPF